MGNNEKHKSTIPSEVERVINHTLPVYHPLTEVMGVQHLLFRSLRDTFNLCAGPHWSNREGMMTVLQVPLL